MVNNVFKPYNPEFPDFYKQEKKRLEQFLTGKYRLEHFGSTSIPGLGGKGIIDIFLVASKQELPNKSEEIKKAEYESRPNSGTEERFVYIREITDENGQQKRFHMHITDPDNFDFKKDIAFRDYLRTHPEDRDKYAEAKKKAADGANQSKEEYMRIKEPIISEIVNKALRNN